MYSVSDAALEDHENLIARGACVERSIDLAARARLVEVGARQHSARKISSTSLRGSTPLVQGFVPTRKSYSAPLGSHSLSLSRDDPTG